MSLQINTPLTTRSNLSVPSGSYCWIKVTYADDFEYKIKIKLYFFKDKSSFDLKKSRFDPLEISNDKMEFQVTPSIITPSIITTSTYLQIHTYVQAIIQEKTGPGTVDIVQ